MEQKYNFNINSQNDETIIRMGQAAEPFNYPGTIYKALSTEAFEILIKWRQTKHTVVGYHDSGFTAILDDSLIDMKRDMVLYRFENSLQMKEWKDVLQQALSQKTLIDFIKCRRDSIPEIPNSEVLLYNLQNFKFVQNIEADYSRTDNNNYTFAFKSKDGEGTVDIPQQFTANIEIIKESGFLQDMDIELEIRRPKNADEKPSFILSCPKLGRYEEMAKDHEYDKLKELLNTQTDVLLVNASF